MAMHWLSFAGDQGFLGVAIVEAPSGMFLAAVSEAHARGINPGGEVKGFEFPPDEELAQLWAPHMNKLLSKAELEAVEPMVRA